MGNRSGLSAEGAKCNSLGQRPRGVGLGFGISAVDVG
jgi:hypothetical protein